MEKYSFEDGSASIETLGLYYTETDGFVWFVIIFKQAFLVRKKSLF